MAGKLCACAISRVHSFLARAYSGRAIRDAAQKRANAAVLLGLAWKRPTLRLRAARSVSKLFRFRSFVLRSGDVWGSFGNRLVGWFGLRELPGRFIRPGCLLGGPWLGFVGSFGAWFGVGRNCCEWRLGMGFCQGACWRVAIVTLQELCVLPWLSVGWFVL